MAPTVLLGLEGRHDRTFEIIDEATHVSAQLPDLPAWQRESQRSVALLKVVDVAPIGVGRRLSRLALEVGLNQRVAPAPGRPHGEQVVALVADADPKLDCLDRPLLPGKPLEALEGVGRVEAELVGARGSEELRWVKWGYWHEVSVDSRRSRSAGDSGCDSGRAGPARRPPPNDR